MPMKRNKIIRYILWISVVSLCFLILYGVVECMAGKTYELRDIVISEEFDGISMTTGSADIRVLLSESDEVHLECYEQKNIRHMVSIEENTLTINAVDTRKWWERMESPAEESCITLYLPYSKCGPLSIRSDTGKVEIAKDFRFEDVSVSTGTGNIACYASAKLEVRLKSSTGEILLADTKATAITLIGSMGKVTVSRVECTAILTVQSFDGDIELSDVACRRLRVAGKRGDLFLRRVTAVRSFILDRTSGNISFEDCDAQTVDIITTSGNVTGNLLSEKAFNVNTKSGKKDVPASMTGEACNITTDSGNVHITISQNEAR